MDHRSLSTSSRNVPQRRNTMQVQGYHAITGYVFSSKCFMDDRALPYSEKSTQSCESYCRWLVVMFHMPITI